MHETKMPATEVHPATTTETTTIKVKQDTAKRRLHKGNENKKKTHNRDKN